jgi:hypothetical protein
LINDVDPGDTLIANLMSGPVQGVVILNPNGSFSYQPPPGFTGFDSFTHRASDYQTQQHCNGHNQHTVSR